MTWQSSRKPRTGYDVPTWLTASEFEDSAPAVRAKCSLLADLLVFSRKTVVYTGAGISVAAGIKQAAAGKVKKAADSTRCAQKRVKSKIATMPTYTHYAVAALEKLGLVQSWIQQNV